MINGEHPPTLYIMDYSMGIWERRFNFCCGTNNLPLGVLENDYGTHTAKRVQIRKDTAASDLQELKIAAS